MNVWRLRQHNTPAHILVCNDYLKKTSFDDEVQGVMTHQQVTSV